ncbi:MAG: YceI family protein [Candidatus Sulfotelmatobacter sp.]
MVKPGHGFISRHSACGAAFAAAVLIGIASAEATAQTTTLHLDPQRTPINFTLGDVLHTVHGTFRAERGSLNFDAASGGLSGGIVVDARSGQSGNGMRDRKMHREVLESERYPEITFRPDRVDGTVSSQGKASVRLHGIFGIHGADHELTVPAEVELFPDHWTATLHFSIPYVNWGMKNPSTLFLRVSETVAIDVNAVGTITRP